MIKKPNIEQQFDLIAERMEQIFIAVTMLAEEVKRGQKEDMSLEKGIVDIKKEADAMNANLKTLLAERAKKNEIENAQLGALFNKGGFGAFGGKIKGVNFSDKSKRLMLKDIRKAEELCFADFLKQVASGEISGYGVRHRMEKVMQSTPDIVFCK